MIGFGFWVCDFIMIMMMMMMGEGLGLSDKRNVKVFEQDRHVKLSRHFRHVYFLRLA